MPRTRRPWRRLKKEEPMREETDRTNEQDVGETMDVFETLKADHRMVKELFSKFEDADKRTRSAIAEETLTALEVHTAIEEELVYPAIADVIDDEDGVKEAVEEHHVAKLLIKELRRMKAGEDAFATKFKVLGELVAHHIEEEETEMIPQAEDAGIEKDSLSRDVMKRKAALMRRHGGGRKSSGFRRGKAA